MARKDVTNGYVSEDMTDANDNFIELYEKADEVVEARDGEGSLLAKEQAQDQATTSVADEVVAARDGEVSLLAKEQAQDQAIASATSGSGVLVSDADKQLGFINTKMEFSVADFVTEILNPGENEVFRVSLQTVTPGEDAQALGMISGSVTISAADPADKLIGIVDFQAIGDITFTFDSVVADGKSDMIIMRMINPGAYTFTWPGTVLWDNDKEPAWVADGLDGAAFILDATGGKWRGFRWWTGVV